MKGPGRILLDVLPIQVEELQVLGGERNKLRDQVDHFKLVSVFKSIKLRFEGISHSDGEVRKIGARAHSCVLSRTRQIKITGSLLLGCPTIYTLLPD